MNNEDLREFYNKFQASPQLRPKKLKTAFSLSENASTVCRPKKFENHFFSIASLYCNNDRP